ncbi:MAG: prepilin-type N-terminal cleavage/methylation domain-containing protein [Candidatus Omnitrophica bacterium]|nr:prepilin-type N-terminal cleavage/methylation domain-containing protein [Candidatus Omnitrophota bacterium]
MSGLATLNRNKGFTFVEVMVVLLILAGIIAGFSSLSGANFTLLEQVANSNIAINDARSVLENMRNIDPFTAANLTAQYPDGAAVAGFNNLEQETVRVNYVDLTADPIQVTITVSWEGKGGAALTEEVTTLLTAR